MKRVLLLLVFVLAALLPAIAQDGLLGKVDRRLENRKMRARVDSAYIGLPQTRWKVKTSPQVEVNGFGVVHLDGGEGVQLQMNSSPAYAEGFAVAWHNLEVGFSVNPAWFIPRLKNKDQTYSFSMCGNRFGLTAKLRSTTTMQGTMTSFPDSTVVRIPQGSCYDFSADFDAYYAFNGREFSFPAVFTQSQIQKKSAGSPFLSLSVRNGVTVLEMIPELFDETMTLTTNMLAVGGGYGHNFVTPHRWLLHVSAMANAVLLKDNTMKIGAVSSELTDILTDFIYTFQWAVLRTSDRWFYGANSTVRLMTTGRQERYLFGNSNSNLRLLIGAYF